MTVDEAIELADEWAKALPNDRSLADPFRDGWRVACKLLADEVRAQQEVIAIQAQAVEDALTQIRSSVPILDKQLEEINRLRTGIQRAIDIPSARCWILEHTLKNGTDNCCGGRCQGHGVVKSEGNP